MPSVLTLPALASAALCGAGPAVAQVDDPLFEDITDTIALPKFAPA